MFNVTVFAPHKKTNQNIENNKVYSYKIAQFLEICKIFYERLKLNENVKNN